jgi:hypothetical protein
MNGSARFSDATAVEHGVTNFWRCQSLAEPKLPLKIPVQMAREAPCVMRLLSGLWKIVSKFE